MDIAVVFCIKFVRENNDSILFPFFSIRMMRVIFTINVILM